MLKFWVTLLLVCSPFGALAVEGCGGLAPPAPATQLQVAGLTRSLISVVPADYSSTVRHRLIIAFHGRTNPAAQVRRYYNLERHASVPTIFIYPSGLANAQGRFSWWAPGQSSNALRAYALFDAIRARFSADYCIGEILLVGHSLGASIVNNLGCARGQYIRAIATLAGGMERPDCRGRVAAMLVHNPEDRLVPIRFGQAAKAHLLVYGGYAELPQPEEFMGLDCQRYSDESGVYPLLWCLSYQSTTRRGRFYPHQWPAGTGARIMAFFDSLPPAPEHHISPEVFR